MNFDNITQEILSFAGTFNVWLVVLLFSLASLSEFSISIPYLMETLWILSGYYLMNGSFSVYQVVFLGLMAVAGRILGACTLFSLAKLGSSWFIKLYHRIYQPAMAVNAANSKIWPMRALRKINIISPYSVAFGRFIWLKVPLTLTLGAQKRLKTLLIAVILYSIIWDCTYILVGIAGGNTRLEPAWFLLYSLAALTVIYALSHIFRKLMKLKEVGPPDTPPGH